MSETKQLCIEISLGRNRPILSASPYPQTVFIWFGVIGMMRGLKERIAENVVRLLEKAV
jgi:hypothetical protein